MSDDEKRKLIGEFFEKVAQMNPCEVVRLLEFFRSEKWEEQKRLQRARVKTDRNNDPAATPPSSGSVVVVATSGGR
jgi:hypothetical protein